MTCRKKGRLWVLHLLVCVVFMASACASSDDTAQSDSPPSAAGTADFLGLAQREMRLFQHQEQQLLEAEIERCMTDLGYPYSAYPRVFDELDLARAELSQDQFLKTYGYGFGERLRNPYPIDPNLAIISSLGSDARHEYEVAFYGVDLSTGCASTARTAIDERFGLSRSSRTIAEGLREPFVLATDDPAVVDSLNDWRLCMTGRGWPFTSPTDIITYLVETADGVPRSVDHHSGDESLGAPAPASVDDVDDVERQIADDDLECGSAYRSTFDSRLRFYQSEYISRNEIEMLAFREFVDSILSSG